MSAPDEQSEDTDTGTGAKRTTEHRSDEGARSGERTGRRDDTALSYEQARDGLTEVVQQLEAGGISLEESLALWERGEELVGVCERHLAGARERVDRALSSGATEGAQDESEIDEDDDEDEGAV